MIDFWEDFKHLFGTQAPELISWFADHWKEVFINIWRGTKAIFINMGKNIWNFLKAIKGWLSGDGWNFDWTPMLDGFKSALTEMPHITKRTMTEVEKEMTARIRKLQDKLVKNALGNGLSIDLKDLIPVSPTTPATEVTNKTQGKTALAARESRFLTMTSGSRLDPATETKKNTAKTASTLVVISRKFDTLIRKTGENNNQLSAAGIA